MLGRREQGSQVWAVMREQAARELLSSEAECIQVRFGYGPKVGRVVPYALCGHEVAHRNRESLIGHAEVRVLEAVDQPGRGSLVETAAGGVLGAPVHDLEAAPEPGAGEVAGCERQAPAPGVAGDDVVDVVRVGSMSGRAARFHYREPQIVVDTAVRE